jgi:hypothetical protein
MVLSLLCHGGGLVRYHFRAQLCHGGGLVRYHFRALLLRARHGWQLSVPAPWLRVVHSTQHGPVRPGLAKKRQVFSFFHW